MLTGLSRVFCADLPALVAGGDDYTRAFLTSPGACFEVVLRCQPPVVAAVDGHAIAGGCVLVGAVEIMRWRLGAAGLARRVLLADTVTAPAAVAAGLAELRR